MSIDAAVIERDARANIGDWPVKLTHLNKEITASLQGLEDVSQLMVGGLLDDMLLRIVAINSDFIKRPQARDLMDVQLKSGEWKTFEVANPVDYYDPLSPTITFTLKSIAK
jgi:hypothetical protein